MITAKQSSPAATHKKYPAPQHPTIEELKQSSPAATRKKYPAPQRPAIEELKQSSPAATRKKYPAPQRPTIEELKQSSPAATRKKYPAPQRPAIEELKQSFPAATHKKYPAPQRPTIEELKQSSPAATCKKYPAPQRPTIEQLRKKYESAVATQAPQLTTPKMLKKSKVKQMASMFNSKISQIIRCENQGEKYSALINELSPEAKPQPKATLPKPLDMPNKPYNNNKDPLPSPKTNAQPSTMDFEAEDNFAKLTVKDKVQLYTQFIDDMPKNNSKFVKHAQLMKANVKKASGEVVNEKQESVKYLAEAIEARCKFPKQTISPLALQRINTKAIRNPKLTANGCVKSKEFEGMPENKGSHTTTLYVTVKPTVKIKKQRRAISFPRRRRDHEQILKELAIIEPCHKRNNNQMHSVLPIEAYAPPKKIRRARSEGLAPQTFFQSQQMENLFFIWLRERQDIGQQEEIVKESVAGETKTKSSVGKLLEEATAKLETVEIKQKEALIVKEEEDIKVTKIPKITPRKKKPAPPVPQQQTKNRITASSETSTTSTAKHSASEESESGVSALSNIASEESPQTETLEKEGEHYEKVDDLGKPVKPLRKKKMRRTLPLKKDNIIEETLPITTTDSDSEYKIAETKTKNKVLYLQAEIEDVTATVELDKSLMLAYNSPRKIKSVCTPTPTPGHQEENNDNDLDTKHKNSRSWPSMLQSHLEEDLNLESKAQSFNLTNIEPSSLAKSFIDQGFETGSNEMDSPIRAPKRSALKKQDVKVYSPFFAKFAADSNKITTAPTSNAQETPFGFSTPIKGQLQQPVHSASTSPAQQQLLSPITMPLKIRRKSIYDIESSRNSLTMQVIREDHPLEHHEMTSPRNLNTTKQTFFAPTFDRCALKTDKTSQFWIKCGDFSVSLDIHYNDTERLRLLYEIFSQRICETKDLHFGIDNQKFSVHNPNEQENIPKHLSANKNASHYWFSTGELAMPFSGKRLSAEKIQRLFGFIKAAVEETGVLSFGIDAVEFSKVHEFWSQSHKFSMESNYSMLVGLQSGSSNGLEGRSKLDWPNMKSVQVSDLYQSDYESVDFEDNDCSRLSFSHFASNFDFATLGNEELSLPRNSKSKRNSDLFSLGYENEPLDQLFEDNYNPSEALDAI